MFNILVLIEFLQEENNFLERIFIQASEIDEKVAEIITKRILLQYNNS